MKQNKTEQNNRQPDSLGGLQFEPRLPNGTLFLFAAKVDFSFSLRMLLISFTHKRKPLIILERARAAEDTSLNSGPATYWRLLGKFIFLKLSDFVYKMEN